MSFQRVLAVLNTLALRGLGSAVAVFFTILIARYFDTSSAAQFFLLLNICTISAVCFRWGLDEVIIRQVAQVHAEVISETSCQLVAISHRRVGAWFACSLVALFVLSEFTLVLHSAAISRLECIVALGGAAFVALTACIARTLQGAGRTNIATFVLNIAVPGLSLMGLLVLVKVKNGSSVDLIVLYFSVAVAVYLACLFRLRRLAKGVVLEIFEFSSGTSFRSAANKLGFVVLAQQVLGWVALLLVPYIYGAEAYKGFVVIQKISTLISLIMLAVNFTYSRKFASLYAAGNLEALRANIKYSLAAILLSGLMITITLVSMRSWIFIYTQVHEDLTALLLVLLSGQLLFSVAALFSVVLSMAHDDSYLLGAQTVINGLGSILFIIFSANLPLVQLSVLMTLTYLVLSLALGKRVWRITRISKRAC